MCVYRESIYRRPRKKTREGWCLFWINLKIDTVLVELVLEFSWVIF